MLQRTLFSSSKQIAIFQFSKMATSVQYRVMWISLVVLCILGCITCMYAYYVEVSKENDANYRAACDISEYISCSKVFTSRYGRGFGIIENFVGQKHWLNQPNSVFGLAFYSLQMYLSMKPTLQSANMQIAMSVMANCGSIYLACILYFVLGDFCVVCVTMYVVNFLILMTNIIKKRQIEEIIARRQTQKTSKLK